MILPRLSQIAQTLGFTFLFGERQAFNDDVDYEASDLIVMYHEGYISGTAAEDQQGAWEFTYSLRIWLLIKNTGANDTPLIRLPRFQMLEPKMFDILNLLKPDYILSNVTITEGINQADKNLDGIRFTVTAKSKYPERQCI